MIWSSRTPGTPWYDDWIVGVSGVVVVGLGLVYLALHRTAATRGDAPHNDAIPSMLTRVDAVPSTESAV
jgi:hypothetical protein